MNKKTQRFILKDKGYLLETMNDEKQREKIEMKKEKDGCVRPSINSEREKKI